MAGNKTVAIVILNWNGTNLLGEFLPSVIENSKGNNIRIIVADNGSTDGSPDFVRKNFPGIELLNLGTNHGFAKGYNLALEKIDTDYFVLLNSDIEVTPGWLDACLLRLESDQKIAAVQPKVLSYHSKQQFEYAGAAGGYIDRFGYPFCRGRILNVLETDSDQYNIATPVFWATGACLFIRRSSFFQAGGFDDDFWAHMEEIDLCWRLKNQGFTIWYEPESKVYHLGGGSLPYNNPKKIFLNFRNNLWVLYKNLPASKFTMTLIFRLVLDGAAAFKLLSEFNLSAFFSVFRAHFHFYKTLGKFRRKRKMLSEKAIISNHMEIYKGSIVWDFYFRHVEKFSSLHFYKNPN